MAAKSVYRFLVFIAERPAPNLPHYRTKGAAMDAARHIPGAKVRTARENR